MFYKIEIALVSLIIIMGNEILGGIVAVTTFVYYGSMLKVNVVDKHHNGSWWNYFKSYFLKNKE